MPKQLRRIYSGRVVQLDLERLVLPNGDDVELEIVRHPGGAAVVAVDREDRVCLLRQYRHAAGGWIWELPAGKLEPKEAPESTARRELAEEGSVAAADWVSLGRTVSSPGVFTEVVHLYLARELSPVAVAPERGECFEVHWTPLSEALGRALAGDIDDAKSAIGLLRAGAVLGHLHSR